MDGPHATRAAATLAASALLATLGACANDNNNDAAKKAAANPRALKAPILAPCARPQFSKPRITPLRPNHSWSVQYARVKPPNPPHRGATTNIVIVQYPPATPLPTKRATGAKPTTIAGHKVNYSTPNNQNPAYTAQWKTKRALYSLLANGTNPTTTRQFINCLP